MQYTKEIAILNAAFCAAEKQAHPTSLLEIRENDSKCPTETLVTAIHEIIEGLEYPTSQPEKDHFSFVVHSVLFDSFYKSLAGGRKRASVVSSQFHPLNAFPGIGANLYFKIITTFKWGHLFGQMMKMFSRDNSKIMFQEIVRISMAEQQMEHTLSDIFRGLLLSNHNATTNSLVNFNIIDQTYPSIVQTDQFEHLEVFFDVLFDALRTWSSNSMLMQRDVLYNVVNLCFSQLFRTANISSRNDLKQLREHAAVSSIQYYQKLQQTYIDDGAIHHLCHDTHSEEKSTDVHGYMKSCLSKLDDYIAIYSTTHVTDECTSVSFTAEDESQVLFLEKCCHIWTQAKQFFAGQEEIVSIFPHLVRLEKDVHLKEEDEIVLRDTANESHSDVQDNLQEAIWRIDNRLSLYQDSLKKLLTNSYPNDQELWISCLERNFTSLSCLKLLKCLVDCILEQHSKDRIEGNILKRLLKVLLKSKSGVGIGIQNTLREYWIRRQQEVFGVYLYEEHMDAELQQDIIVAFNKLVSSNNNNNIKDLVYNICHVAIQSPRMTIKKSVSEAVHNAVVIPLITQVFQEMPSLCTFRDLENGPTYLCSALYDVACHFSSPKEEANFQQLITSLLQPFKPPTQPHYAFMKPALLSSQELLDVCIYPNLHHHSNHLLGNMHPKIHQLFTLQLLQVVLDTPGKLESTIPDKPIETVHIFPIMLCLASFIDECHILWDADADDVTREEVKELSKRLVQMLCSILQEQQLVDEDLTHSLKWLMFKVKSFHWSTDLQLRFLLAELVKDKEATYEFTVSRFLNVELKTILTCAGSLEQNVLTFLQCCQVSKDIGELLSETLQAPSKEELLQSMLRALTQILPHCTLHEWCNITSVLQRLIHKELLLIPLTSKFIHILPLLDLKDFSVQLSLSQLHMMVLTLLKSNLCLWSTTSIWQHILKCYVAVMKEIINDILGRDAADERSFTSRGFVIGQLFCHSLEVMNCAPEYANGQLFVLSLEILARLEDLTKLNKCVKEMFLEMKQIHIFEHLIYCMADDEQKTTMQQKLQSLQIT